MMDILQAFDLRVSVRILAVTDGAIELWNDPPLEPPPASSNRGFTLREMARALWDAPEANYPYTRFIVDHAVHGTGAFAKVSRKEMDDGKERTWTQYDNFRFDVPEFRLANYDQVWLFGFWPGNPNTDGTYATPGNRKQLSESELKKLAAFMNAGGGVFATGDHGLLGMHLAGDVPRVRAMRRWHSRGLSDDVPSNMQGDRIDTIVPVATTSGGLPVVHFDDQSDDVPKPLGLKRYSLWDGLLSTIHDQAISRRHAPHPLLCSPLGAIDRLPDHMHEGIVREDGEVQLTGKDQTGADEFPGGSNRPRPEVIAWTTVRGGDVIYDDTFKLGSSSVIHRTVPVVSVYDGERAKVGRVVVDSTWHNWLDINVRGTGAGRPVTGLTGNNLELVHYYVRNIAQWLASPAKREAMRNGRFFTVVAGTGGWSELRNDRFLLGSRAHDVLGQVASPCERSGFVFDGWLDDLKVAAAGGGVRTHALTLPPEDFASFHILGAMVEAVFDVIPELEALSRTKRSEKGDCGNAVDALAARLREARHEGVRSLVAAWRGSLKATGEILDLIDGRPSPRVGVAASAPAGDEVV
jgi:hypothetical protein